MNTKLRLMRILWALGVALLLFAPSTALAHDNLGGDELAASWWMLVAAVVVIIMGLIAGIWAIRDGQFSNVEESKYRMIEIADDYDAIMAEVDERERTARASATQDVQKRPQAEAATVGKTELPAQPERTAQARP
jgi:nitrogen fixation-related uncharacterized protein